MIWESCGAIAGVLALVFAIFIEWPKAVERFKNISPLTISVIVTMFFFMIADTSITLLFKTELQRYYVVLIVVNFAANLILGIIFNQLLNKYLKDSHQRTWVYFVWGILIYFQLLNALLFSFKIL
jgi:hypothetical protein